MTVGRRRELVVLVALFAAYASFYLCRANVDAALPLLSRAFGYDKEALGRLSSIGVAGYALGKITLGPLGDVFGGRRLILAAVVGSVVASFAFGASSGLVAFAACAAANRWAQAGGWVGLVHVASREFRAEERGARMGVLSTSYEIGNVLSLLLCGALVRAGFGWRALFVANPVLFGCVGLGMASLLRRATEGVVHAPATVEDRDSVGARIAWLVRVRSFWIAVALSFLLTFIRTGFLTWTPTYLAELGEREGGGVSTAILKSAVFPAMGVLGAIAAGRASDRLGPGRRAPLLAGSLALLVLSILMLGHLAVDSPTWSVVAIATSGLFLLGPYSLVGGSIVLDVGQMKAAATAAGWIDAGGYVGASLAGVLLGVVAQRKGWSSAFDVMAMAAAAALIVAVAWSLAAGTARRKEPAECRP